MPVLTPRMFDRHRPLTLVLRYAHPDPRNLAVAVERVAREPVSL